MSNKFSNVELIEYLTNIGFMTDFDTEKDKFKLAEIQGKLLELTRVKRELKSLKVESRQLDDSLTVIKDTMKIIEITINRLAKDEVITKSNIDFNTTGVDNITKEVIK